EKEALGGLEKHWGEEKEMVIKVLDLRAKLRAAGVAPDQALQAKSAALAAAGEKSSRLGTQPPQPVTGTEPSKSGNGKLTPAEREKLLTELKQLQESLRSFQGENPL